MSDHHRDQSTTGGAQAVAYGAAGEPDTEFDSEDGQAFLADLARAMQATVGAERLRITESADERRQAHIEAIRGRETSETDELREVAESDVKGIESWATAEIERIRLERQRRIAARKKELGRRLEQHHALIEQKIAAVDAAVVAYREEVDRFFGRLDAETDPMVIAREASRLPPFPALEAIRPDEAADAGPVASEADADERFEAEAGEVPTAEAEAADGGRDDLRPGDDAHLHGEAPDAADQAASEPVAEDGAVAASTGEAPVIGVMHGAASQPAAMTTSLAVALAPWDRETEAEIDGAPPAPAPDPKLQATTTTPGAAAPGGEDGLEEAEPLVGAGPRITARSSGAVIQSVPSLRPIGSWLKRTNNPD